MKPISVLLVAQLLAADPGFDLQRFNEERFHTGRVAMGVLGGWAVANLGAGIALGFLSKDTRWKTFWFANAAWNVINLSLAVFGWLDNSQDARGLDLQKTMQQTQTTEKVFLINTGLDLAYIASGAFAWQRGDAIDDDRWVGLGQALIVQGVFLLLFDGVMSLVANGFSRPLERQVR